MPLYGPLTAADADSPSAHSPGRPDYYDPNPSVTGTFGPAPLIARRRKVEGGGSGSRLEREVARGGQLKVKLLLLLVLLLVLLLLLLLLVLLWLLLVLTLSLRWLSRWMWGVYTSVAASAASPSSARRYGDRLCLCGQLSPATCHTPSQQRSSD